jgi:hypothetical protein
MSHRPEQHKEMYQTPKLSILGDIRQVTKATGKMGADDGGKGMDKTGS